MSYTCLTPGGAITNGITGDLVTSSSVLSDATGLFININSGQTIFFEASLIAAGSLGGINVALNGPAGASTLYTCWGVAASSTAFTSSNISAFNSLSQIMGLTSAVGPIKMSGYVTSPTGSGPIQVRMASVTNLQSNSIKAGSYIRGSSV